MGFKHENFADLRWASDTVRISVLFTTCRVVLFTAASFDIKARLCGISMPLIFTLTFHKGSYSTALPLKWTFRG